MAEAGIKFLTDINEELSTRRNQLNKLKALQREADEQKKELQEIHQKVNSAWQEKVRVEQQRTNELEKEWKCLLAQIQENADTPGYKQAMTHTDLQTGQHSKQDAPSTRKKNALEEEVRELRAGMSNRRSVTPSRFSSSIPDLHLRSTARVN
ncbi:hypothetical protein V9T40_005459 [Parthenolecanium corni]|uniref:Uncharacterized protein n=1 Tax=Parthenolecanium corni TaxID=536013 RepID=A0AAN9Y4J3_9HEMI